MGRKNTYFVFSVLGIACYCFVPYTGEIGSVGLS